jgi:hypothetical protein
MTFWLYLVQAESAALKSPIIPNPYSVGGHYKAKRATSPTPCLTKSQ